MFKLGVLTIPDFRRLSSPEKYLAMYAVVCNPFFLLIAVIASCLTTQKNNFAKL